MEEKVQLDGELDRARKRGKQQARLMAFLGKA